MIKKTFKELRELDQVHGDLLAVNESFKNTKLGYALKRFTEKNIVKPIGDYNLELAGIRIDNALTDKETGALLYVDKENRMQGGREFQYSKEGLKTLMKAENDLSEKWANKEIEIEPYICKDIKGINLTDEQKEVLTGLVI